MAYPHIELAYAQTTHKGQGQTADNAFILAGGEMTDRELSYVQTCRARKKTKIYSDIISSPDITYLAERMARSNAKDMAHDYVREIA